MIEMLYTYYECGKKWTQNIWKREMQVCMNARLYDFWVCVCVWCKWLGVRV